MRLGRGRRLPRAPGRGGRAGDSRGGVAASRGAGPWGAARHWGAEPAGAGEGARVGEARGGGAAPGARRGGPGGRTHSRFPGQLLHSFRLQLAVGFPHPRRRPRSRARPRRGTQRERLGRGGARGPAGQAGSRAFVCAGPAEAGARGPAYGEPGPSGRRPLRAPRLGCWAGRRQPRCRRGRPWLLSSAAHARCCASLLAAAPALPPPARTGARGGPGRHSAPGALPPAPARPAGPAPADRRPGGAEPGRRRGVPHPGFIGPRAREGELPPTPRHLPGGSPRRAPAPAPHRAGRAGGAGRSDLNEAEARARRHSFIRHTDLWGAGDAAEQDWRGPSPHGVRAGGGPQGSAG